VEFITDRKILNAGINSKAYQYSLISVGFNHSGHSIVNHFNLSTIKKRIIMMNTKKSSRINLTRYAFMVPALITLLLIFSISKADFAKPIRAKLIYSAPALAKIMSVNEGEPLLAKPVVAKAKKVNKKVTAALLSAQKADTVKKAHSNKNQAVRVIAVDSPRVIIVDPKIAIDPKISVDQQISTNINATATASSSAIAQVNVQPNINVTRVIVRTHPKILMVDTPKSKVTRVKTSKVVVVTSDGNNTKTVAVSNNNGLSINTSKDTNPLILLNDKEISHADLTKIDPNTIEALNVTKANDDSMIKKYGEKAKDGVIMVTTKKLKD
jgi:hypothetical protein